MHLVTNPVRPARAARRQHSVEIVGHEHSRDLDLGTVNRAAEPSAYPPHTGSLSEGAAHSSEMACWDQVIGVRRAESPAFSPFV
jgi:hypothetical protein